MILFLLCVCFQDLVPQEQQPQEVVQGPLVDLVKEMGEVRKERAEARKERATFREQIGKLFDDFLQADNRLRAAIDRITEAFRQLKTLAAQVATGADERFQLGQNLRNIRADFKAWRQEAAEAFRQWNQERDGLLKRMQENEGMLAGLRKWIRNTLIWAAVLLVLVIVAGIIWR